MHGYLALDGGRILSNAMSRRNVLGRFPLDLAIAMKVRFSEVVNEAVTFSVIGASLTLMFFQVGDVILAESCQSSITYLYLFIASAFSFV